MREQLFVTRVTADAALSTVFLLEGKAHMYTLIHLVLCMYGYHGQSGHALSMSGFNSTCT